MGRRQLLRVDARIEVEFKSFEQFYTEYTTNISQGGLFIKTDNPQPEQSVVEVRMMLPEEPEPISLVAEVVHVIGKAAAAKHGWETGMGMHFVDYEETAKEAIENYIRRRYKKDPKAKIPDRRNHMRVPMRLRVKFPDMQTLMENYARDISQGGIFIESESPKPLGEIMVLTLVHPDSGEELDLKGEVVRVSRHDPKTPKSVSGMAIRFLNMDEEKRDSVNHFLAVEYPVADKDFKDP